MKKSEDLIRFLYAVYTYYQVSVTWVSVLWKSPPENLFLNHPELLHSSTFLTSCNTYKQITSVPCTFFLSFSF